LGVKNVDTVRVIIALVRLDRQDWIVITCLGVGLDHMLVDVNYRFHIFSNYYETGPHGWTRTTDAQRFKLPLYQLSYTRIYHLFTGEYEDGDIFVDRWQGIQDSNL
jgi:hypothetical protein